MNLHRPSYESYSGMDMIKMIIEQQKEKAQSQKRADFWIEEDGKYKCRLQSNWNSMKSK